MKILNEKKLIIYLSNQYLDMKIKINYSKFLYKIYDLDVEKNDKTYIYKNSYCIEKIKNIEFYEIIYKTDEIIKKGKTIVI